MPKGTFLSYQEQLEHNERMVSDLLQKIRPDVWVLMDLMDKTGLNPMVLFKFIRQINNIILGSRYGQVTVVIADGIVKYIRGEDTDKIEESAIIEKQRNSP